MKISKTAVLALWWVFATAGLWFMYVSAAEKWVFMNLNNAVQHFVEVKFVEKWNDDGVMIKRWGNTNPSININRTDAGSLNFILTKTWATELNTISNSKSSSILWWVQNTIYWKDNNVILWWELNTIKWSSQWYNNVILWWNGNTIQESSQSTILGWNGNTVNWWYYQTVIWNDNHTNASSSVAIWKSNNINQNATSSAALWSNATVSSAESFIWSDGKTSTLSSQAFAVVWENWMAVNAQAHAFAKLTIWGSLRINELSSLSCDSSKVWVVKMVTKSGSKKCFCSCDGTSWNSLNWGGSCASKCDSNVKPSCGTDVSCGGNPIKYEWSCTRWKVVEWDDAYFIDKTNKLHWSCEEEDGSVVPCAQPAPTCNVSVPQASCNLPAKSCNLPVDGDASLLKQSAVTEDENNYYWTCYYGVKDTPCKLGKKSCNAEDKTYWNCKYSVPALSNGASQTVSNSVAWYNWSVLATCNDAILTYSNWTCTPKSCGAEDKTYWNCKYSVPALSNGASQTVSNSVAWYNWSVKATCTNWKLTYSNYVCKKEDHGECDTFEPYWCQNSKNTVVKVDTMSSTEWQWYCKWSDDTGNGSYCHVNCAGLGQEWTLKWTSLHNGTCLWWWSCADQTHAYHAEFVGTNWYNAMIKVWTDYQLPVDVTYVISYGYNVNWWFDKTVSVKIPAGEDMASSDWFYVWGRNGSDLRINSNPDKEVTVWWCKHIYKFVPWITNECSGWTPLPSKDSTKYKWNPIPYSTKTYWEYVDPSNFNPGIPCAWTCQDGYAVNSTKTECVLNAQPVCWNGEVNHYGQLQTSALCDSSSNYSNLNSTDWRETEGWCGTQAWTRTCRHKESGNEKRCYQTKRVAHFGMTFTPATRWDLAAGIIWTLSTWPDDYKWSDVEWFYVELKVTSNSGREWNITVVVSPKDTYLNQDRITYTLRVWWNPPTVGQAGYPEMTIGMPNSYIGGPDMSVKKVEITAIHPRRFASDYIWWQYIPKYDALGHRYDYLGNKQCNSNVWVIYWS